MYVGCMVEYTVFGVRIESGNKFTQKVEADSPHEAEEKFLDDVEEVFEVKGVGTWSEARRFLNRDE